MSSSSDEDVKNLSKKEIQEIERKKKRNKQKKQSKKRTNTKENKDSGIEVEPQDESREGEKDTREKQADEIVDIVVDIEYVGEMPVLDQKDPNFTYFNQIFNTFKITGDEIKKETEIKSEAFPVAKKSEDDSRTLTEKIFQEEMLSNKEKEDHKLSKKKLRLMLQPSIAALKENTPRPDVVEWADVTSRDPHLLVAMKAYRNTVPVPRHWNAKRKYLAGKRGFERAPFQLPDYIRRTGIQEMRESLWEKEHSQNLKSVMRERARPKLGKIDIDYQKLHDAFFKWQTKPFMTKMGELYYEGKEGEAQMRDLKPGNLSDELRIALGMPVGPNAQKFPPPWLIAMQRYGPPPSYPTLKIAGLSAPIPEGCSFGYHAGGWGKPPVDDFGKPLYGDVFGLEVSHLADQEDENMIERRFWGEIGTDESSEEESEEEEEEEQPEKEPSGMKTPMGEGFATPSGIASGVVTAVSGMDTPETIELRKGRRADESTTGADTPAAAYHIIPEKKVDRVAGSMMASTHVYDLSKKQAMNEGGVEISLDPESMELDQKKLEEKYEEQLRKQSKANAEGNEDFSDMVAEHSASQNRKRKAVDTKKTDKGSGKKQKDFKF